MAGNVLLCTDGSELTLAASDCVVRHAPCPVVVTPASGVEAQTANGPDGAR